MGLLAWIRDVWGRGRTTYRPTPDLFPQLDLALMARRMRLVEEGRRRGSINEPRAKSDVPDEIENRIITSIEEERRRAFDEVASHLRAVRERMAALQVDALINRVAVAGDVAIADLKTAVSDGKDRL